MVVKQTSASNNILMKKHKTKNQASVVSQNDKITEVQEEAPKTTEDSEEANSNAVSSESNGVSTFKRLKLEKKFTSECELPKDQIAAAVSTTCKAYSAWKAKNKEDSLFSDESEIISLQVSLIKIPTGAGNPIQCSLPHPFLSPESDIILIVKDLEKGWEKSHEPTTEFFTELLAKKGVVGSYEVLPLRQLRVENKPYEARNKLSKRLDAVFVDKRVAKFVPRYLGKAFYSSGKLPVALDLEKEDLQKEFSKALSTSMMSMMNEGVSARVAVGRTHQSEIEIIENVAAVCEKLKKKLPGNFCNVRALSFHIGDHSWSVPLYASFATKDTVSLPANIKIREPVVDELTTLEPGWKVAVYPGGEVKKIRDKSVAKASNGTSDVLENSEETQMETTERARPKRASRDVDVDSSDDDADRLEEQYLEEIDNTDEEDNDDKGQNTEVPPLKRKK